MFPATGTRAEAEDPSITCPLGKVFSVVTGDTSSTDRLPDTAWRLATGARIVVYRAAEFEAQLLIGEVSPALPPGMVVAGCVAGVWRVQPTVPIAKLAFECRCAHLPSDADGGGDNGEGLDAITWTTSAWEMSIGTEDGEYLRARALRRNHMPRPLAEQLDLGSVEHLSDGLRVPFRDVPADEVLQVQFLISWCEVDAEDRAATWFAVEQDPAFLIEQLTTGTGAARRCDGPYR